MKQKAVVKIEEKKQWEKHFRELFIYNTTEKEEDQSSNIKIENEEVMPTYEEYIETHEAVKAK